MNAIFTYNPLSKNVDVNKDYPISSPNGLQSWCRRIIIKAITLKNLQSVRSLPVPSSLKSYICDLTVDDFFIKVDMIPPEGYVTNIYPAVSRINGAEVTMKVLEPGTGETVNKNDFRYITSFEEEGQTVIIEERTKTLSDVILQCRRDGKFLTEEFIWRLLLDVVKFIIETRLCTCLGCQNILFLGKDEMFIEIKESTIRNLTFHTLEAIYDAPEIISFNSPDSRAHSWSIGCIIYEVLALKPAFYDETGENPFQVFVNINNGNIPKEPINGSRELKLLMRKCLVHNNKKRIRIEDLYTIVEQHVHYNIKV